MDAVIGNLFLLETGRLAGRAVAVGDGRHGVAATAGAHHALAHLARITGRGESRTALRIRNL